MKNTLAILLGLAIAACVVPPPQAQPQASVPDEQPAEPDDGSGTYDDGSSGGDTSGGASGGSSTCGSVSCGTNADCPGGCGGCSEWSHTCLLF